MQIIQFTQLYLGLELRLLTKVRTKRHQNRLLLTSKGHVFNQTALVPIPLGKLDIDRLHYRLKNMNKT